MKSAKKAKLPKTPKAVKLPKKAIPDKLSRQDKKYVKLAKKDLIKRGKIIKKSVGRAMGLLAVTLCVASSVLDILLQKKGTEDK